MQINRLSRSMTVTLASGGNVSEVFELGESAGLLVKVPAATGLDANSKIRLEVAHSKTTTDFAALDGLADLAPNASAALWMNPDPDGLAFPAVYGRLVAVDAAGSAVNQSADRSFMVMLKG